jgi:hypothetical protein
MRVPHVGSVDAYELQTRWAGILLETGLIFSRPLLENKKTYADGIVKKLMISKNVCCIVPY